MCVSYRFFLLCTVFLVIENYAFSLCFCMFAEFTDDSFAAEIDLNKVRAVITFGRILHQVAVSC